MLLEVLLIFLVFVLFDPPDTHFKVWKNCIATGGVNSLLFTSLNLVKTDSVRERKKNLLLSWDGKKRQRKNIEPNQNNVPDPVQDNAGRDQLIGTKIRMGQF